MNVLYITAACLTKNTSANMSHNAFVKGLLDNGYNVDVIMSKNSWGEEDKALPKLDNVRYFEYDAETLAEKLRKKGGKLTAAAVMTQSETDRTECCKINASTGILSMLAGRIRNLLKKVFYSLVHQDSLYPLENAMFTNVLKFNSDCDYHLIISNSSPAASHKVAEILIKKKRVKSKRWVQIWEDPWYYDLYGGRSSAIKEEEHRLLNVASEVYYVSPLTMMYQMQYFPDCSEKMKIVPLPFFQYSVDGEADCLGEMVLGYFGDYFSCTRNLRPFYEALCKVGCLGYIYGDSDENLQSTDKVTVSGRVTLDILDGVQRRTNVLVHLCNLKGGQIPGKIYHYSATRKKILFILDGDEKEKDMLLRFFSRFNRYYFCNNDVDEIVNTIERMKSDTSISNDVIRDFEPKNVVEKIINKESFV